MTEILILIIALIVFGLIGNFNESNSFREINRLNKELSYIKMHNTKKINSNPQKSGLVIGDVVIATDFFKMFFASLKTFFGGRLNTYESLLQRAKKIALIRMLQMAHKEDFNEVYNIRIEMANIGRTKPAIEVLAYGTGIKTEEPPKDL
ncbi:MAG: YbjQ family protein [Candidatus Muiribacteriota bacterium]